MRKPHHGYLAYMTTIVIAACLHSTLPVRLDPKQRSFEHGTHKASNKKRGKRHGRAKR